jgi:hypothetical protein
MQMKYLKSLQNSVINYESVYLFIIITIFMNVIVKIIQFFAYSYHFANRLKYML